MIFGARRVWRGTVNGSAGCCSFSVGTVEAHGTSTLGDLGITVGCVNVVLGVTYTIGAAMMSTGRGIGGTRILCTLDDLGTPHGVCGS